MIRMLTSLALVAGACLAWPVNGRAVESHGNCTAFNDTLPGAIGRQGNGCLRENLSTAMTRCSAIENASDDLTVCCSDFQMGGLDAGPGARASGVDDTHPPNSTRLFQS